jgi:hypothetical protein
MGAAVTPLSALSRTDVNKKNAILSQRTQKISAVRSTPVARARSSQAVETVRPHIPPQQADVRRNSIAPFAAIPSPA